jgi:class 3 adenylate cyclase
MGGLAEERRHISVLFADVKESTALVVSNDPEDVGPVLEGVLARMIEAVTHYDGTLNQTLGDGIMALFGAATAHEDHALRACFAALRMQAAMRSHADHGLFGPDAPLRIRVGIHTGFELIRPMTGNVHMAYSAVGQTSYLAAKLEQNARPGCVLVSADVMQLVEGRIECRPVKPLQISGLRQPLRTFELGAVKDTQTRFEAAARRGLNAFVGRDGDLAQLDIAAQAAAGGAGHAIGLLGDPGVGKTRLLWEFKNGLQDRGWRVLEARSLPGTSVPLGAAIQLLRGLLQATPRDSAAEIRTRMARYANADAQPALDTAPLLALLDLGDRDRSWLTSDPAQRSARTHAALVSLFLAAARREPLVIAVEDVHWADSGTSEFLDRLVGALAEASLLVLLEFRPEFEHRLQRHRWFRTMRIGPLPEQEAGAMFRSLAGSDASLRRLESTLFDRTEGNPFFLEEAVRALCEVGVLVGERAGYRLGRPAEAIEIPPTVKIVLASRVARLAGAARELLEIASVIGRYFDAALLSEVAGLAAETTTELLATLDQAGLLKSPIPPSLEYRFEHAFTQEVAYESVLRHKRQQLHGRILAVLEAGETRGSREHVEQMAHHAVQGERWDRAIVHLQSAAARALDRAALRETVRFLEEAIRIFPSLPPALRSAELAIDLRLDLRGPLLALGKFERVIGVLREAEALAEGHDDAARRCRVAVGISGYYWLVGHHEASSAAGERALEIAMRLGDEALLIPARQYLGGCRHSMGEHAQAQAILSANIDILRDRPDDERYGMAGLALSLALAVRGWSQSDLGHFQASYEDAEEALAVAQRAGHGFSIQGASFVLACVDLACGHWQHAYDVLDRAREISSREHHRFWLPLLGALQAQAAAYAGRHDRARALIDKACPDPDRAELGTVLLLAMCDVYRQVGRVDAAAKHAERALERSRIRRERGLEAAALWLLGQIGEVKAVADLQVVAAYYRSALQRAEELRLRPLAARCRLGLASTLAAAGSAREALAELAAADAIHRAAGLTYWCDEAERQRQRIAGPIGSPVST